MRSIAKLLHGDLIRAQEFKLFDALGSSFSKNSPATKTLTDFIEDFEENKSGKTDEKSSEFNRAYALYVASEQILENSNTNSRIYMDKDIDFSSDNDLVETTSEGWTQAIIENSNISLQEITNAYFSSIKEKSFREMKKFGNPQKYIEFNYQPTKIANFDDIVGNEVAKLEVYNAVRNLFSYDSKGKKNAQLKAGRLNSHILLVGEPGSGKSMIAEYAINFGKELAEKHNVTLNSGELHFNSENQDGPIIELRKQLKEINKGEDLYIIFMDEVEDKFPLSTHNQEHKGETVNELKKFIEGVEYQNKGNYIIFAATNHLNKINKEINSRLKSTTYHCKGPISAKEKATVFKANLEKQVNEKYFEFEWNEVNELFSKYTLSGRHLRDAAKEIANKANMLKYTKGDYPDEYYKLNFTQRVKYIQNETKPITIDDIIWGIEEGYTNEK